MIGESNFNNSLRDFAVEMNNTARRVLGRRTIGKNRTYGEATGSLRESLTYKFTSKGGRESVEFFSPLNYAQFIHWGVNGTGRNRGAPYSYTTKQPPWKGKESAIRKWMKAKPIRLRDSNGAFVKQTESRLNSMSFLISRAIKKNGIAGLFYYSKAYIETIPKWRMKFGDSLIKDFITRLSARVDNVIIKP